MDPIALCRNVLLTHTRIQTYKYTRMHTYTGACHLCVRELRAASMNAAAVSPNVLHTHTRTNLQRHSYAYKYTHVHTYVCLNSGRPV